ncbi:MAG: acyltransferase [Kiritimatiellae bacterium]|nr:acyltransferase [Kiritimatiellia bacterium]
MKTESVRIQQEMDKAGKSKLSGYQDLIVGRPGWWPLIQYELIMLFCSIIPGALGLFLRSLFYPFLLGACGKNVNFGANVILRHPHKIKIGDNVIIDDNCLLDAKGRDNEGIAIGSGVFIGRNSILSCKNGDIILQPRVNIGFNSEIFSGSRVEIGRDTLVAAYCYFVGGDHAVEDAEAALTEQGSRSRGITVGANCWFGAGTIVLDGITTGNNAIIGAGAVVTKNVAAYAVAVGIPARQVRDRRQHDGNEEGRRQKAETKS